MCLNITTFNAQQHKNKCKYWDSNSFLPSLLTSYYSPALAGYIYLLFFGNGEERLQVNMWSHIHEATEDTQKIAIHILARWAKTFKEKYRAEEKEVKAHKKKLSNS